MTTITILINKDELTINELSSSNIMYIQDYINYKLLPYKYLNHFNFNIFSNNCVDGLYNPKKIKSILQKKINHNSPLFICTNKLLCSGYHHLTDSEFDEINKNLGNYCIVFCHLYK